jgi:hypothetical protein
MMPRQPTQPALGGHSNPQQYLELRRLRGSRRTCVYVGDARLEFYVKITLPAAASFFTPRRPSLKTLCVARAEEGISSLKLEQKSNNVIRNQPHTRIITFATCLHPSARVTLCGRLHPTIRFRVQGLGVSVHSATTNFWRQDVASLAFLSSPLPPKPYPLNPKP